MRKSSYPTRIRLDEVSANGEDFAYSKQSGELNQSLKDLIGNREYSVKVHLKPMGNVYEITCDLETSIELQCSRCGRITEQELQANSHELLVIEKSRPRNSKSAGSSQESAPSGPFCNYIPSSDFNIAEFIHEQIASNEPYIVECGRSDCQSVMDSLQGDPISEKESPFAALKGLIT